LNDLAREREWKTPGRRITNATRTIWDATMIYHNPPAAVLEQAEVITLFDFNIRGWKEVVVSRRTGLEPGAGELATIHIPVDSTNIEALQSWRARITLARAPHGEITR
jgi:hypothetical protein